ncbi:hypothetical protein Ahy_A05g023268 isoform B [Arachis hypogaea]|uniref:Uncharacterized protein n=1 Tax=Arachis hypogaea TaxID=3818 RepID=A0A445BIZ2_ARAHY|nr:hypothetical protein Ahy_Scaffold1g106600 isoform B [Arachis hypogaea]RYQ90497.1 hypothetical protein Ahy_B09g096571 isoform B [Arachis hypogaea]RYR38655.1 hypothetical protein Ahy_A09g043783 isoform B [Arachis hypogaea]RYR54354.1 hypothetical protein Ahy_A06g029608 isoform B [Arachis hypogaea]RYR57564.1 hypothetical protein Ahy_A05g023268 isoform B [Arachis hypogaea]
MEILLTRPFLL